jgi:hypothetical protein
MEVTEDVSVTKADLEVLSKSLKSAIDEMVVTFQVGLDTLEEIVRRQASSPSKEVAPGADTQKKEEMPEEHFEFEDQLRNLFEGTGE